LFAASTSYGDLGASASFQKNIALLLALGGWGYDIKLKLKKGMSGLLQSVQAS
jgi:hypothetical protein